MSAYVSIKYRPLRAWTDPVSDPQPSPFTAKWSDTQVLLRREVDVLSDLLYPEVVIELDVPASSIRADGELRGDRRVQSRRVVVSFDSRHGPLRYATDEFLRAGWQSYRMPAWQCNVRAIALALEALRKVDRYGVTHRGEQYTGWKALGSGMAMPAAQMSVDEAARVLHAAGSPESLEVPHTALIGNPRLIGLAYRAAAKHLHPDVGGDEAMFKRVTEARDLLAARAAS